MSCFEFTLSFLVLASSLINHILIYQNMEIAVLIINFLLFYGFVQFIGSRNHNVIMMEITAETDKKSLNNFVHVVSNCLQLKDGDDKNRDLLINSLRKKHR